MVQSGYETIRGPPIASKAARRHEEQQMSLREDSGRFGLSLRLDRPHTHTHTQGAHLHTRNRGGVRSSLTVTSVTMFNFFQGH